MYSVKYFLGTIKKQKGGRRGILSKPGRMLDSISISAIHERAIYDQSQQ